MDFRTATPVDAPAVAALVNSGYRGESSQRGWTTEAELLGGQRTDESMVLEMIQGEGSRVELACGEGGELLGCVHLKKEPAETCYLGMLTVDPARQARGIGKRLLAHAEACARLWGCARLRLTVIAGREELLRFYERRGYARTGAWEPFPEHDARFGIPKVKGLRFVELVKFVRV
ncbi:MAG: GNAT family N-acetyltransferase [Elusimicrobia bacterium]|nr:GNAT family N-acetyltransferase [Elusimicrobiota bacterium]